MKELFIFLLIVILNQFLFNSELTDLIVYTLTIYLVFRFIRSISVNISIFEVVGLIAALVYLLFPVLVYNIYNEKYYVSRLFETFMTVDKIQYFSLALPGTLLFIIGLNSFKGGQIISDAKLLERCKLYLKERKHPGVILIIIGVISSLFVSYIPESFRAIVYYFSQLTFIGFLYLLHSNIGLRKTLIVLALSILIGQSVMTGMYGELVYWSVLGGSILIVNNKGFSFFRKAVWIIVGVFMIFLIQSIKHEYREYTWGGKFQRGNLHIFYSLVKNRIENPLSLFNEAKMYAVVIRGNQGRLVGRAMEYVPDSEEFANGETIYKAIAASIIPRFLWLDKPRVGGAEHTCRFLGDCSKREYSYNIGQLGESYVNFGVLGGSLFMFIYGAFMRFTYNKICNLGIVYPSLILWIPLFYFMAISLETDFITYLNSFIKAVIFAIVIYQGFRLFLRIRI